MKIEIRFNRLQRVMYCYGSSSQARSWFKSCIYAFSHYLKSSIFLFPRTSSIPHCPKSQNHSSAAVNVPRRRPACQVSLSALGRDLCSLGTKSAIHCGPSLRFRTDTETESLLIPGLSDIFQEWMTSCRC